MWNKILSVLVMPAAMLALWTPVSAHSASQARSQKAEQIEQRGNHYLVIDQFDKALPLIKQAIQMEPNRAGYWQDLGVCLSQMNRKNEAISAYQTADRLKPNYWLTLNNLAITLNQAGRHSEAVAAAKRAIKAAGPDDQDTIDTMNKIIHQ